MQIEGNEWQSNGDGGAVEIIDEGSDEKQTHQYPTPGVRDRKKTGVGSARDSSRIAWFAHLPHPRVQGCGSISHFTERSKEENGKTRNASNEPPHDGTPESLDRGRYLAATQMGAVNYMEKPQAPAIAKVKRIKQILKRSTGFAQQRGDTLFCSGA
jgi:hypothetical protein